ncbi:GNAT family N-acetyltransferase [Herbaspirillum sp.]|uniref:GNAT family N-acetyltransferase n=1 Tax=Herbaspirillum sp. TaxID=1890675 RepID=UPI001B29BCC9|nr:GNAT family N-acetyltransferase [Herbaspirillum sp.]MBO9537227.1 GNAT family N-acetyltransferase [Herbaspirillum sp.]
MLHWIWKTFDQLSLEQLYDAIRLRQQVFVIEQECLYPDADGFDPACLHGLGYDNEGALMAYARVLPPGVRYAEPSIGRLIVAEQLRGKGAGEALMKQAMARTTALYPGMPMRISAQARLERFYRRLGFISVGDLYDDTGIPHVDMLAPADVQIPLSIKEAP